MTQLMGALTAVTTAVKRNENIGKLQAGYLFPEVSCLRFEINCSMLH